MKPRVSQAVWYWPVVDERPMERAPQPNAAIITYVWSDELVNLVYFDSNGKSTPKHQVAVGKNLRLPFCEIPADLKAPLSLKG